MRMLVSALYNIGYCNQQINANEEAKAAYVRAVEVMRAFII
jgi:hypothetical protein